MFIDSTTITLMKSKKNFKASTKIELWKQILTRKRYVKKTKKEILKLFK